MDDDYVLLRLYSMILEELGLSKVEYAENGHEAVEKFKNATVKPAVIIMDHRMPVMDGIRAMLEIRGLDENVKIIFCSADFSVEKEARSLGADAFIKKPFDIRELRDAVMKITGLS